ncbi:MAG: tetratricopeptide repeat protein, partial [Wenzhouxiangella sp.]
MLVATAWPVVAAGVVCAELPERADRIRALRDHDAAGGVARGRALLEELDAAGTECPAGRMLLQAAVASNLHIQGRNDAALDLVGKALTLVDRVSDPVHRATVHRTAGVIYWELAAHDRALEHYHRALADSREADDHNGVARTAGNIGNLHNTLGNWEEAERYHLEALEAFQAQGWEQGVAGTLVNLGALAERRAREWEREDEPERARAQYEANLDYNRRALAIFERMENPRGIAYAADNVARALISLGRPEEAMDDLDRSLALRREVGDNSGVVQSLLTRADALAELEANRAALDVLDEAYSLLPESSRSLREEVFRRQIDLLAETGDFR